MLACSNITNEQLLETILTLIKKLFNFLTRRQERRESDLFKNQSNNNKQFKRFQVKILERKSIIMPAITCNSNNLHISGSPVASPTTPTATTTSESTVAAASAGMAAISMSNCVRTLIVDDNVITAKVLSKILSKEFGHNTSCAISGKEALIKLSKETYDIIFMDIDMPELSGIETTIEIHKKGSNVLEQNRNIPIIAYTTNPCEERFFEAGMNGWVGKPAKHWMVRKELERVYSITNSSRPSSNKN